MNAVHPVLIVTFKHDKELKEETTRPWFVAAANKALAKGEAWLDTVPAIAPDKTHYYKVHVPWLGTLGYVKDKLLGQGCLVFVALVTEPGAGRAQEPRDDLVHCAYD